MSPIPIHNHSEYSALDGYGTVEEIADRIEELDLGGAFLTDHGNVAGFVPFAKAMKKKDLFAGFGMEAYQAKTNRKDRPEPVIVVDKNGKRKKQVKRDSAHLILLAKNQVGYHNLLRLSDESNRSGFYYHPRLDWELLEKYHEGIIATSACMAGLVAKGIDSGDLSDLDRYLNIFKDDFYLELHTYDSKKQEQLNNALVSIADERGIPLVYANDAHYPCKEDHIFHEALQCMQYGTTLDESKGDRSNSVNDYEYHPPSLYIMGQNDIENALYYLPENVVSEAIKNSELIADQCSAAIPAKKMHLPKFTTEDKVEHADSSGFLIDLVEDGIVELYGEDAEEEVWQRAEYELKAICKAGLADYFLINWDWIKWAEHKGIIIGPGRGSAGGSIISYAIGITSIDPIKYKLSFERFWNPGRAEGLPDIDVDIEQARRGEIKDYLSNKYGSNRVVSIGNHIRMRPKSALDKAGKVIYGEDCPYGDLIKIKKIIESTTDAGKQADWPEIWALVGDELEEYKNRYVDLFDLAQKMTGRISTYGIHASAVVVSDVDLPGELPVRMATDDENTSKAKRKILVTQLEMHGVEDAGFPKFDLLGLRNLDTLKLTATLAGEENFRYRSLEFESLPVEFWQSIEHGHTLGLFQVEEGNAARKIGKQIKPRSILDLAAIVSLNRPGPLRSGVADRFVECHNGSMEPFYSHDILEPILKDTYGDFLYQESVIDYFSTIGYNSSDADHIRKMLGKKLVEEMTAEYPNYIKYANQYMPEHTAKSIWESIIGFSKYSFNKSHAVGYGIILAWTMYAKWRWPTEFIMASIMTNPKKAGGYVSEGRRIGIDIKAPDINKSDIQISKIGNEIYFGLHNVKGVGEMACQLLIENRPYKSLEDLNEKLDKINDAWKQSDKAKRHPRSPRQTLPKHMVTALYDAGAFDEIEKREVDAIDRAKLEENLLGVVINDPNAELIRKYSEYISQLDTPSDLDDKDTSSATMAGVITSVRKLITKPHKSREHSEKEMAIIKIEMNGEECSFAAFPKQWKEYKYMLKPYAFGEFEIKKNAKGNSLIRSHRFVEEQ